MCMFVYAGSFHVLFNIWEVKMSENLYIVMTDEEINYVVQ